MLVAGPALPKQPNHLQGCTLRPNELFLEQREMFLFPAIAFACPQVTIVAFWQFE